MTPASTAVVVLLVQQLLFAALWTGMAVAGLSRGPAMHWAVTAAGLAGGMALVLVRDTVDPLVSFWLGNLAFVGAFVALRRGVERFARRPPAEREHVAVMGLWLLSALLHHGAMPGWQGVSALSLLMAYVLARAAWTVQTALRDEFGVARARVCAAPVWITALVLGVRGAAGPLAPTVVATAITTSKPANLAMLVAFVFCGIALTLGQLALVVTRLVQRLRHLSDHDALTGVLNRRSIEGALAIEAARLARHGHRYAVLALDIDHFKLVNDRFGHPAGDAVLRELARLMRQAGRSADRVARTGGEEFWMLLPDTRLDGALQVAERLQALVRAHELALPQARVRFTVSIGIAVAERPGESPDALLHRLDAALYRAKHGGRDRIEVATEETDPPAAA